jgi:DNA-binding transcriptional LysR family regulator
MLAQRRDHRRLGRQLRRIHLAVAMAQAPACLGNPDEVTQVQLLAYNHQHLKWQVQQGDFARRGWGNGEPLMCAYLELFAHARQHLEWQVEQGGGGWRAHGHVRV